MGQEGWPCWRQGRGQEISGLDVNLDQILLRSCALHWKDSGALYEYAHFERENAAGYCVVLHSQCGLAQPSCDPCCHSSHPRPMPIAFDPGHLC